MKAMMDTAVRQASAGRVVMPPEVKEVMERHLEVLGLDGLPTSEIVAAICEESAVNSHKEKVLKYFLLESPLRAKDLGPLLCSIGKNRATQLCQEVAHTRVRRLSLGRTPRWEEEAKLS